MAVDRELCTFVTEITQAEIHFFSVEAIDSDDETVEIWIPFVP